MSVWRIRLRLTEWKKKNPAWFFDGAFLRDEWEEFWRNVNRRTLSAFWCRICCMENKGGGAGGTMVILPTLFSFPWSSWGFSVSVATLISTNLHVSTPWKKKKKTSERCRRPANPTIPLSSLIITMYSGGIPGFKNWCAGTTLLSLAAGCDFTVWDCRTFWYSHPSWPFSNMMCVRASA